MYQNQQKNNFDNVLKIYEIFRDDILSVSTAANVIAWTCLIKLVPLNTSQKMSCFGLVNQQGGVGSC